MKKYFSSFIELIVVLAITALIFAGCKELAFEERGYVAVGGEYFVLLTPFAWLLLKGKKE